MHGDQILEICFYAASGEVIFLVGVKKATIVFNYFP